MRWLSLVPLAFCSIPLFVIDIREHRLPNPWNAALAGGGLLVNGMLAWSRHSLAPLVMAFGVGLAGLLGMFALHWVTRGGLGLGDVKLVGALGCAFATPAAVVAIVGAAFCAAGVVVLVLLLARRRRAGDRIAFGPFLLLGAWLVLVAAHG